MDAFIDHINIKIPENSLEKALNFYRDLLGFETWKLDEYRKGERTSFFFKVGENSVLNIRPVKDFERPSGKNLDHFCIVKDTDVAELKSEAQSKGFEVLREGTPLGTQGRAPAVYLKDPFSYVIEVKEGK